MLTTTEISNLITSPHAGTYGGKVAFLAQREARRGARTTPAQRAFLNALAATPAPQPAAKYAHPGARPRYRAPGPISPVELAWLNGLPTDPAQVSHEDARTLAGMLAATKPGTPEARLVEQHYLPLKELHDQTEATVAHVAVTTTPVPALPSQTLNALTDAIGHEHPTLTPDETLGRARTVLEAASAKRRTAHDQAIATATDQLTAARAATAARTATGRQTP